MNAQDRRHVFGLLAEFAGPAALMDAARACRARYRDVDAYTPYPIAYFLQWYSAVIDYPINSGGRPLHSWPAFIPPTFELTVLGACLAAFLAMLLLNGLPRLNHPIFEAPDFDLATRNRFFLAIRATEPGFDVDEARALLASLHPMRIVEVPA
jgi:hypothetical protein